MASVTQCDVCGNIVKHEESKFLRVYRVNSNDSLRNPFYEKELCPLCFEKVKKTLNEEEK